MKLECPAQRWKQSGSSVLVVEIILAIIFVLALANTRTTYLLGREVKLVEDRQIRRWQHVTIRSTSVETNRAPALAQP